MQYTTIQQVFDTLDRASEIIISAAGEDGIVSRRDIRTTLTALSGFQQALVDSLYRYIDRIDNSSGARVTKVDVLNVITLIKKDIIAQFEIDPNGLSFEEEERISTLGPLAIQIAQNLKRAAQEVYEPESDSLLDQLESLSQGLFFDDFGSESSERFETFFQESNLLRLTELDFIQALGLDPTNPSEAIARFEPAFEYFDRLIGLTEAVDPELAERAIELVDLMKRALRSIHVIIQGLDQPGVDPVHPVYVVGLDRENNITGLRSSVVWT